MEKLKWSIGASPFMCFDELSPSSDFSSMEIALLSLEYFMLFSIRMENSFLISS